MASYPQGYDEERFETTINRNFQCLICFNVLKNPVLCPRNQHHFCRACISKFLENSQRCPTCSDELTVETLTDTPRFVKDYLNELDIHCKYVNRGCHEIVQLQHLEHHEATCGFTPVVCTNQGCDVTVNKRDQIHHESELCEFRRLKCHSCGEMATTLADMEKRMANVEKNMANVKKNMETSMAEIKTNMEARKTDMEEKFEAVNNEMRELKTALIEGFNELKEVLVKMEDEKEENTKKVRPAAGGDKENIIVAADGGATRAEIFNWRQRLWSPLQSLPQQRWGATSFVYDNHVTIAGGCSRHGNFNNMMRMNVDPKPDLSVQWSECAVKLPGKLAYHRSVLYNDQLIVTGGYNGYATSDRIDEVQLVPPYTVKALSRMPEPRRNHCIEIFDDSLLIIGGRTAERYQANLSSVVLYDIKKNECKQLAPLPYEVSEMSSVRWGDNIVVIGGVDKRGKALDTVIMYDVNTEQHHMLPSMRCKRYACAAVVIRNNIVVLGGVIGPGKGTLKSVEAFNFHRNTWEELPQMSGGKWLHTAVAV